jgi:hypothetical protein
MALSKQQLQAWALERIEAAFPPSASMSAVDDLYRVRWFFRGQSALLFGMKTTPGSFEDPEALVERAQAGLRAWFDHFGKAGEAEQQARLYGVVRAADPSVAEPELVRRQREAAEAFERAKQAALANVPRPVQAIAQVSHQLAARLREARGGRDDDFFARNGGRIEVEGQPSTNWKNFTWESADPEWDELVGAGFDAPFFPFAGADGDSVGVLVLEGTSEAPVVYFSHEEGYFLVAESLEGWNAKCEAAAAAPRGAKRKSRKSRARGASVAELVSDDEASFGVRGSWSSGAYGRAFEAARAALASVRQP